MNESDLVPEFDRSAPFAGVGWVPDTTQPAPPTTLWDRARRAADRADAAAVRTALAEAHRHYGPSGRRLLGIAVLNLLALRVADQQAASAPTRRPWRGS